MSESGIPFVSNIGHAIAKPSLGSILGGLAGIAAPIGGLVGMGAGDAVSQALKKPVIPKAGEAPVMPNANNQNAAMQAAALEQGNKRGRASTYTSGGSNPLSTGQPTTFSAARSLLGA